jgi:hypothetical protein
MTCLAGAEPQQTDRRFEMDFKNRIRPANWASPLAFLHMQMPEEEYRELLREHGYGEQHIENELKLLRKARQRYGLPGPPEPARKDDPSSPFDRLAKRRRKGGNHTKEKA